MIVFLNPPTEKSRSRSRFFFSSLTNDQIHIIHNPYPGAAKYDGSLRYVFTSAYPVCPEEKKFCLATVFSSVHTIRSIFIYVFIFKFFRHTFMHIHANSIHALRYLHVLHASFLVAALKPPTTSLARGKNKTKMKPTVRALSYTQILLHRPVRLTCPSVPQRRPPAPLEARTR